jgi:sRNA-binding carbon storage regulator CsrA
VLEALYSAIGQNTVIEVVAIDNGQERYVVQLGIQLPDEVALTLPEVKLGPKGG